MTHPTHPLMTHTYKLRIHVDCLTEPYQELCKKFVGLLDGAYILAYEQDAKRPHIQGFFTFKSPRADTAKAFVKKSFPGIHGQGSFSCVLDTEPETFERYKQYVCKEQVLFSSYSETQINEFKNKYIQEGEQIKKNLKKNYNKTQKSNKLDRDTHFLNICERIEKNRKYYNVVATDDCPLSVPCPSPEPYPALLEEITQYVVEEYADTFFSITQLEPIVNRLIAKYHGIKTIQKRLLERISPRERFF